MTLAERLRTVLEGVPCLICGMGYTIHAAERPQDRMCQSWRPAPAALVAAVLREVEGEPGRMVSWDRYASIQERLTRAEAERNTAEIALKRAEGAIMDAATIRGGNVEQGILDLTAERDGLRGALEALGVKPYGYCFCANQEQALAGHTGECQDACAALLALPEAPHA